MGLVPVSDAATRLGVSTRQVQNLIAKGDLRQLARGIIDEASIARLLATRGASHTRAWSEATAWGAVSLLTGGSAEWVGQTQRSRLRARLRGLTASALVTQARGRAQVSRYRAHSRAETYLSDSLVAAGGGERLGLTATNAVDGYLAKGDLSTVVRRYGLIRDDEGRVTLRATTMSLDVVARVASDGDVLAALDLGESLDVRERRAGLGGVESALETFRA